jgi:pentalenene oxygenase
LPVVGHVPALLHHPLAFLSALPSPARIEIGPLSAVVVSDPELTRQVLLDDRTFDKGGTLFERLREIVGDGLATCPHARHRRQRRLSQPAFHPARLPGYAETMTACATALRDGWHEGQVLDVRQEMMGLTIGILMETMFSGGLPAGRLDQCVRDVNTLIAGVYRRAILPPALNSLPTPGNRRYLRATARLRATVDEVVAERRRGPAQPRRQDLLSALLSAQDTEEEGRERPAGAEGSAGPARLSAEEISDQAVTYFLAGAETGAIVLAWALHLLSRHPRTAARVRAEAQAVHGGGDGLGHGGDHGGGHAGHGTGHGGGPAGLDRLAKLEVTARVVQETLRLYPPAWMLTRTTTADTRLAGHPVAAGTTVVYSPYLVHHSADSYPDPELFDPDRWDGARPQPPRHAFIPFGGGARKCIGDRFGTAEAVLALSAIAARWQLEPLPGRPVRPATGLTLSPRGLRLRVTAGDRSPSLP